MMKSAGQYSYDLSVKSDVSDELINVYVLRPIAGVLVQILYRTPVTPNTVTLTAVLSGMVAAALYLPGTPTFTALAGVCITVKDLLDSADGQLARAKRMFSRTGRFLDSIGDFLVNLLVFSSIGYTLSTIQNTIWYAVLAVLGFMGITLRVSYHVFYQTSFLHLQREYEVNRVTEEIREGDLHSGRGTLWLQRLFQSLYGWQDRLMLRLDRWCRESAEGRGSCRDRDWYGDRIGLRLSGFLGMGTELLLLTACSLVNQLALYLYLNLLLMNGVWAASIWYRRHTLARR